jgi:hypothetical protein
LSTRPTKENTLQNDAKNADARLVNIEQIGGTFIGYVTRLRSVPVVNTDQYLDGKTFNTWRAEGNRMQIRECLR